MCIYINDKGGKSMIKRIRLRTVFAVLIIFFWASLSHVLADPCSKKYKQGYCEDYIHLKTGKRQPGLAHEWKSNIDAQYAKSGDVAIFKNVRNGQILYKGHVALINSVNLNNKSAYISDYNWGTKWVNYYCRISNLFGRCHHRLVKLSDINGGVWRPNGSFLPVRKRKKNELLSNNTPTISQFKEMSPGQRIEKKWELSNNTNQIWQGIISIIPINRDAIILSGKKSKQTFVKIRPGEKAIVKIPVQAPYQKRLYKARYATQKADHMKYYWLKVIVK